MKPQNVICPECGSWMMSRVNRQTGQRFWGCHTFPECKGTRDTDGRSKTERDKGNRRFGVFHIDDETVRPY